MAVHAAQMAVDDTARRAKSGTATADDVATARKKLTEAEAKFAEEKSAFEKVAARDDMPLPTRLEGIPGCRTSGGTP